MASKRQSLQTISKESENHQPKEQPSSAKESIMSKRSAYSTQPRASSSTSPPPGDQPTTDVMQAMLAQLQQQSAINTQLFESLQDIRAALPKAKAKERVPPSPSHAVPPPQQDDINAAILSSLQALHHDTPKPTHQVISKELCS